MNSELRVNMQDLEQARDLAAQINLDVGQGALRASTQGSELILVPASPLLIDMLNGVTAVVRFVQNLFQSKPEEITDNGDQVRA